MNDLNCTCGRPDVPTEAERRTGLRLGVTAMEAHALLDLFTDTFSKVPDAGSIDMNEVTSRMAVKAGVPPELITGFMNTFDRVVDEMDKEGVLFSPADILGRIRRKG